MHYKNTTNRYLEITVTFNICLFWAVLWLNIGLISLYMLYLILWFICINTNDWYKGKRNFHFLNFHIKKRTCKNCQEWFWKKKGFKLRIVYFVLLETLVWDRDNKGNAFCLECSCLWFYPWHCTWFPEHSIRSKP